MKSLFGFGVVLAMAIYLGAGLGCTHSPTTRHAMSGTRGSVRFVNAAGASAAGAALHSKSPDVNFKDTLSTEAFEFLRDKAKLNIFVDWRALEQAGIDRSAPVTLRLHDVETIDVLELFLSEVGAGTAPLKYFVKPSGLIVVTTAEEMDRQIETRTYEVSALVKRALSEVPPPAARWKIAATQPGPGNCFPTSAPMPETTALEDQMSHLQDVISNLIDPESWRDNGGAVGSIHTFGTSLIVTSSPDRLEAIEALLDQLSHPRDIAP